MTVVGHEGIQARIASEGLPSVSLFIGPKSVGRRRFANQLAIDMTDDLRDVFRINRLTADLARELAHWTHVAPAGTGKRVAVVNIQDAPESNLNVLLKALEDVPTFVHIILLATSFPPGTILSRCNAIYPFTYLPPEQVAQVLMYKGVNRAQADILAAESAGTVAPAVAHDENVKLKSLVLQVIRCFREHDNAALEALGPRWTDEHTALLVKLVYEATTKRWRLFNEEEVGTLSGRTWLAILRALKPDVRPRFVIHAQLAGVLRSMT